MPQKTNLNVAPYFDDFATGDNFQQVLFRPGFAVQARELTTLQSILQNQSETSNRHLFKEGAMVVPGQISSKRIDALKLQNQFSAEDVDTSQYVGKVITGATTGVKAKVITHAASTGDDPPTLFIQYISAGTDNVTTEFANNENISANGGITHTTVYSSDVASATTATASSVAV